VSAIDSLKAVTLLSLYDDFHNAHVLFRRYEEQFGLMLYLVFCDDGSFLATWFKNPHLIPSQTKHKIRSRAAEMTRGFFYANPAYDFKGNFDDMSRRSVHASWCSTRNATYAACVRYMALHPEEDPDGASRRTLDEMRAIHVLGIVGPATTRFLEFLTKKLLKMEDFSNVSPGAEDLAEFAGLTFVWWQKIESHMKQIEEGSKGTAG